MSIPAYTRATYRTAGGAFRGNAFIEALPDIPHEAHQLRAMLELTFSITPQADVRTRDQLADRIARACFICLPRHVRLFRAIDELLREGYAARAQHSDGRFRSFADYRRHHQKDLAAIAGLSLGDRAHQASYLSLIGCHGSGKSYALQRILSFYPQVIYHHRLAGDADPLQVVYLRLSCSKGCTVRGLCLAIIEQLGVLTGCSFSRQLPGTRPNAMYLRHTVQRLIAHYHLGLLVIDQLENLMDTQARRDELFAFIESCARHLDTPLLLVAATRILRHTRRDQRVASFFDRRRSLSWPRFTADSACYLNFLRVLWSQQPLRNDPAYIHPEIRKTLYFHSQGIVAQLVTLFVLAVKLALSENTAYLTPGHVRRSFELYCDEVHDKIVALQTHNHALFRRLQSQSTSRERFLGHCAALSASIAALHSTPATSCCSTACSGC